MAEKVGTKTSSKSSAGRDVYLTPDGKKVSEQSVTIKFGKNAYVNAPSIHNGVRYTEDEIRNMLLEGKIKPTSRHNTKKEAIKAAKERSDKLLNKGGAMLRKQMELFDVGGLKDEGGMIAQVSGNEVPPGSTREEVRDDIPAQLSEGEFVFPADVVRYIGLENLMRMRQEAKQGLAQMEAMGQMGNSEEATVPDNLPFDMYDLEVEDDGVPEYAQGGVIKAQTGSFIPAQPNQFGIAGYQPSQFTPSIPTATPSTSTPYTYVAPTQSFVPVQGQVNLGFQPGVDLPAPPTEYKTYVNAEGNEIQVPFVDGNVQPGFVIPEGYKLKTEQVTPQPPVSGPTTTTPTQTQSAGDEGGRFDSPDSESTSDIRGIEYDRSKVDPALRDALTEIGMSQVKGAGRGIASAAAAVTGGIPSIAGLITRDVVDKKTDLNLPFQNVRDKVTKARTGTVSGLNIDNEFARAAKVAVDSYVLGSGFRGIQAKQLGDYNNLARQTFAKMNSASYKGTKTAAGQKFQDMDVDVQRAIAAEIMSVKEELTASVAGKSKEEVEQQKQDMINELAAEGIKSTYKETVRGRTREFDKTYGQLFAEARALRKEKENIAKGYNINTSGKTLSEIEAERDQIISQRAKTAEEAARRERQYLETVGGFSDDDGGMGGFTVSDGAGGTYQTDSSGTAGAFTGGPTGMEDEYDFNKGGLAKQMKQSGLASKK